MQIFWGAAAHFPPPPPCTSVFHRTCDFHPNMFYSWLVQVGWDLSDQFVVTAVNDHSVKVWESKTGKLIYVLKVRYFNRIAKSFLSRRILSYTYEGPFSRRTLFKVVYYHALRGS